MSTTEKLRAIDEKVLARLIPNQREKNRVEKKTKEITELLTQEFRRIDSQIDVSLQGSVAKNTWISGEVDADMFVLFPTHYDKKKIGEMTISTARRVFDKYKCVERYAEHPYVTILFDDSLSADIVPCFKAPEGDWKSATDRTPYHTK